MSKRLPKELKEIRRIMRLGAGRGKYAEAHEAAGRVYAYRLEERRTVRKFAAKQAAKEVANGYERERGSDPMALDSEHIEAMAYALKVTTEAARSIAETAWTVARRELRKEIIAMIEKEVEEVSHVTGWGRSQRTFAKRIIRRITE